MNIWTQFTNLQPNVITKLAAHRNRIYCYSLHHIQLLFTLRLNAVSLLFYQFSLLSNIRQWIHSIHLVLIIIEKTRCFTFCYRFSNQSLINNRIRRGNKIYNAGWHTKNWPVPLKLWRTDLIDFDSTYSFTINGIMHFESLLHSDSSYAFPMIRTTGCH